MNERDIIEAIIDKSDKRRHDKALTLLLYGEDTGRASGPFMYKKVKEDPILSIPFILQDLIRKKFSKIRFEDAYSVFATGFLMHLDGLSPEMLCGVDDLKNWIYIVAKNYATSHLEEIQAFGIGVDVSIDENRVADGDSIENETEVDELNDDTEIDSEDSREIELPEQGREEKSTVTIPFDENEQDKLKRLDFAKWRFQHYLSQMANETYKDLLTAVYIEGVDRETIAEEYGWTMAVFNLTLDRARNAFITVALDDIQHCEPDLFREYEYHKDMDDTTANLLREFFICKFDIQQMALLHHKTNYGMKMALSVAYKKLLRIHKNETELLETERHKEERKQNRMKRLYKMYKGILEKEYPRSFWLLSKYFKEFNGEFSVMTEWAMNNNINVDELERQLEASFDLLNALDKERSFKKNDSNKKDKNNE